MEVRSSNSYIHAAKSRSKRKKDKPDVSVKELVIEAVRTAPPGGRTVSEIYRYIQKRCPDYRTDDLKWQKNVRYVLSANVYFEKCPNRRSTSRGKLWKFNEEAYEVFLSVKGNSKRSAAAANTNNQASDLQKHFVFLKFKCSR